MADARAPFTYLWIIENYSELTYIMLDSPLFVAKSVSRFEWYLQLNESFDFCCWLKSEEAPREENGSLEVEISLLSADGSPVVSKRNENSSLNIRLINRATFLEKWDELLPNNTLTIQCRMWRKGVDIPTTDLCYARTKLQTYQGTFLWPVEKFSALPSCSADDFGKAAQDERKVCPLKPPTEKGPFMALVLYLNQNPESEDVCVDFLIEKGRDYAFTCQLSVLDANGEMIHCHEERGYTYYSWTLLGFKPFVSKDKLLSNKDLFLANDTLLLKCSYEVCTGAISSEIEHCTPNVSRVVKEEEQVLDFYVEEMNADDSLEFEEYFIKYGDERDLEGNSAREKSKSRSCSESCKLKTALNCLYSETTLSDAILRIGTKSYPVHKNILSSVSPVFGTMFGEDTKKNIIDINDMDENTLARLLRFIYKDELEALRFEEAVALFKASADYKITYLRNRCTKILIVNLSKSNARDVLHLANQYQDVQLETAARRVIRVTFNKIENSKIQTKCNLM